MAGLGGEAHVSFRYYLYISDAKVDMLLSQIDPGRTRRRATEVSLRLSVVGAKRSVESTGPDRVARLERVVRHLQEHGDLGTVDEPGQFFWGLLPMQWGPITTGGGTSLVYFGGRTERTIVGLGGSSGHVLGTPAATTQEPPLAHSMLPMLLDGLATLLAEDDASESFEPADGTALASVHQAGARLRGPAQNVEFIAKRLLQGPSPYPELDGREDMTVLLGSPLYVALAD
ncbi:MAG: DUF7019 family protein [Pseudonocardiaceae bacterium]